MGCFQGHQWRAFGYTDPATRERQPLRATDAGVRKEYQMKRLLLLTFALSFVAAAQTMIGLPQVLFTDNQITNQTSKAIFCVVIRSEGGGQTLSTIIRWKTVPPDGVAQDLQAPSTRGGGQGQPSTPDKIYLDGVVFEDGTFIGPDNGNSFPSLSRAVAAYVAAGTLLAAATDKTAAWSQLQGLLNAVPNTSLGPREANDEAFAKRSSAIALINARRKEGDDAAVALAVKFMALGTLRKDPQ
jgi:hypothetical protein